MTTDPAKLLAQWLPERPWDAHKGHFGHAVVVAGSKAMPGAAVLSLLGARRSGAGRITWVADDETIRRAHALPPEILLRERPEPTTDTLHALADRWQQALGDATAILMGPGLGAIDAAREALAACGGTETKKTPVCIDADGLRLVAKQPGLLSPLRGRIVLTPHPGEMAALCGVDTDQVQAERLHWATRLAQTHDAVVLLKGAGTIVASPHEPPVTLALGGPELSHAGTGDVLSGLVVGLLAQGLPLFVAAQAAATAHAIAGAQARTIHGMAGTAASDVAEALGTAWRYAGR